jgi:hypothetical protein
MPGRQQSKADRDEEVFLPKYRGICAKLAFLNVTDKTFCIFTKFASVQVTIFSSVVRTPLWYYMRRSESYRLIKTVLASNPKY